MCIEVSGRRDWIFFKSIWHMASNKTQVEFKKGVYMPINLDTRILVLSFPYFCMPVNHGPWLQSKRKERRLLR